MAEIVWDGKYRDGARVEPSRAVFPIETDEVHEALPSRGAGAPSRDEPDGPLRDDASGSWRNRLVLGDQEHVLAALATELAGKVALVYVDPPFETGGAFDFQASIPGAPHDTPRIAVPAYRDARGLDAWLAWFDGAARRLADLLADGGSLYVHLDAHVAHYAKVVLDEVFGADAFQREIIWRIGWVSGFKSRARGWIRNHDTLLFYAKGGRPATFHKEYVPYPPGYVRRDGKPPSGSGYPIEDVWNASDVDRMDSIQIVSFSGEKVGYPTQKNEALVSRIVRASSNPGDLVLDCFVGSGTSAVVAEKLGRRWVACDASPIAVHSTRKRLMRLPGTRPFVVQHAVAPANVTGVGDVTGVRDPAAPHEVPEDERAEAGPRSLGARLAIDGRSATIELASFALPARASRAPAHPEVEHWSQWIDGWCVDWDHRGGALHAGSHLWRARGKAQLSLSATHAYGSPGRYVALVKAFDLLGGATTKRLDVEVG